MSTAFLERTEPETACGSIYALCEPETGEIRYVGQTKRGRRSIGCDKKLTAKKVAWLRREVKAGRRIVDLANELGISSESTWQAATGRDWKHVEESPATLASRATLSPEQVVDIRHRFSAGESSGDLAEEFSIAKVTIGQIVHGRIWKHVEGPLVAARENVKLTADDVVWLRKQARAGGNIPKLAQELGVTRLTAFRAATGRTWKHVNEPFVNLRAIAQGKVV